MTDRPERSASEDHEAPAPPGIGRYLPEGSIARAVADRLALDDRSLDRWIIPAALFLLALLVYVAINHNHRAGLSYFVPLADAFLHGRLGLTSQPAGFNELVRSASGLYYVVYPPAPAVVLLPAVLVFGPKFHQEWLSIAIGAANVAVVWWIVSGMGASRRFALAMALVFGFGTIAWYSATLGTAWHFAHVVALFFTLLAIRACQLDLRPIVIGLLFAAAILARLPVALAAPFFVAYFIDRQSREGAGSGRTFGSLGSHEPPAGRTAIDWRRVLQLGVEFAAGAAGPLVLYLVYNQLRFGSPFETGHALLSVLFVEKQYANGVFSVLNVPREIYAMFLSSPVLVSGFPWFQPRHLGGLSILLTSPILLWAIRARRPDWFTIGTWLAVALVLVPDLTHADPGGLQFGYRYAQDVYPFLLLLTVRGLRGRLAFESRLAIAIGFLVNVWGMYAAYFNAWK
jgi:hypothetical protein